MISVYDANAVLTQLPAVVAQTFNFTELESVLCLKLVQGKRLDDIADEIHQSREQLRCQFDNLLEKTGTDNEAKLVSVVLSRFYFNW